MAITGISKISIRGSNPRGPAMEIKKRPENPELDDSQIEDLKSFFSGMTKAQLEKALEQTIRDSESDPGAYSNGGVPANVLKTRLIILDALERLTPNKRK